MLDRSATWDLTVRMPHRVCVKLEILDQGEVIHTFEGETVGSESFITEGQASFDREDKVRGKGTVTFVDPKGELTPADASDMLAPYGTEFKPYRGIRFPDGTLEYKPLGIFRAKTAQIGDTGPSLTVHLEGQDRAATIKLAKLSSNWVIPEDSPSDMAVMDLLTAVAMNIEFNMSTDDITLPRLVFKRGDDPWDCAQKVAESCGCELFFDRNGICVMQKVPNYKFDEPVWTFDDDDLQTALNFQRDMTAGDREGPFNHVGVSGEAIGNHPPVYAEAFDDNPDSPTFILGRYGRVSTMVTSKKIKTVTQAQAMADGLLVESLGRSETWTFNHIPNCALDIGDVIMVNRAKAKLENKIGIIDVTTFPLIIQRAQESLCRQRPI